MRSPTTGIYQKASDYTVDRIRQLQTPCGMLKAVSNRFSESYRACSSLTRGKLDCFQKNKNCWEIQRASNLLSGEKINKKDSLRFTVERFSRLQTQTLINDSHQMLDSNKFVTVSILDLIRRMCNLEIKNEYFDLTCVSSLKRSYERGHVYNSQGSTTVSLTEIIMFFYNFGAFVTLQAM